VVGIKVRGLGFDAGTILSGLAHVWGKGRRGDLLEGSDDHDEFILVQRRQLLGLELK